MSVRRAHIAIRRSLAPLAQAVTAAAREASSPAHQHARLTFSVSLRALSLQRP